MWVGLKRIAWFVFGLVGLCWIGLVSVRLGWVLLFWFEAGCADLVSFGPRCVRLGWVWLGWVALGWVRLACVGQGRVRFRLVCRLGCVGLGWVGLSLVVLQLSGGHRVWRLCIMTPAQCRELDGLLTIIVSMVMTMH